VVLHTPLWQSVAARQACPEVQAGQIPPPQSTSVSDPFVTESTQLMQMPDGHMPLEQSESTAQTDPSAQTGQLPPPQSTSVSVPSSAEFVHAVLVT
jgi:hypothetical protein